MDKPCPHNNLDRDDHCLGCGATALERYGADAPLVARTIVAWLYAEYPDLVIVWPEPDDRPFRIALGRHPAEWPPPEPRTIFGKKGVRRH